MPLPNRTALVTLSILLFEHCTTVTLTRLTQQRTDGPRPNPAVLVLITEALKLLLSCTLELTSCFGLGSASSPSSLYAAVFGAPYDTLLLSVPAVLYTIQNLLIYVALGHMEIVLFQVLYQAKLMLTAVFSVLFLRRRLGGLQWLALAVLTVGVVAVEISDSSFTQGGSRKGSAAAGSHKWMPTHRTLIGIAASLMAALLSSAAGVYFEAIVKKHQVDAPSLWVRNVQLCMFTLPVAAMPVLWQWQRIHRRDTILDVPTVLLVVLNASGGLLVAAVIKYGDNILKNFTTACSVILGTIISVLFFGFQLTWSFMVGAALVILSAYAYVTAPEPGGRTQPDAPASSANDSLLSEADTTDDDTPHGTAR